MSDKGIGEKVDPPKAQPGDGIRSLRSTSLFRVVNYELYAKPVCKQCFPLTKEQTDPLLPLQNIVIMSIGLAAFGLALGYVAYMRSKYEGMGYYSAVQDDGSEVFVKKRSKWENWNAAGFEMCIKKENLIYLCRYCCWQFWTFRIDA